jgi:NlpC/P60 family
VRRAAAALALLFALAPAARAAVPVAEVRGAGGALQTAIPAGSYVSPNDYGYLLTVGSSTRSASGVALRDVSMLGGRIRVARMFVPASGTAGARVDGVSVDGTPYTVGPNTVLQVGGGTYAVFLQEAALPGRHGTDVGIVGIRVVAPDRQILVGMARPAPSAPTASPSLLFGLAPLASFGGPALMSDPVWSAAAGGTIGERAVAIAERYLGVPYVWGGASPVSGFDCSGLVMYVYAQLGIHLTHFSGAQWNEGTRILSPDDLLPGDLVFFEPGPLGPGHVGMYIGNGDFIQAPHTGDVVKISSFDEGAYSASYVGAVRPY